MFAILLVAVPHPTGPARARALWLQAQARAMAFDEAGAARLTREAYRADPEYFPAAMAMVDLLSDRLPMAARRRALAEGAHPSASELACLQIVVSNVAGRGRRERAAMRDVVRRYGPSACTTVMTQFLAPPPPPQSRQAFDSAWAAALQVGGDAQFVWQRYVSALLARGDSAAAELAARRGAERVLDWTSRIQLVRVDAALLRARGDPRGAAAALDSLSIRVIQDGRPGLRFRYLSGLRNVEAARTATAFHAPGALANTYLLIGHARLDRGDAHGAIRVLRLASRIADSLGWVPLRTQAHVLLGRAYMKAGRWKEALTTLRPALKFADPENTYYLAEIYHNLAHTYQGEGRMTRAVAAVERFVSLAATMPGDAIHTISLYDAGVIRWEAGLHASARLAFDSMVHVIDARKHNYFYAGEYYERIGNLARALHYYRAVPRTDREEGARALSGLVRVYDALGMPDSAEAAARAHDREVQTPEEVPLLPLVLERHGHPAEAVALARSWADTQLVRENLRGAARARIELSNLLLDAGRPRSAFAEAARADSLSRAVNLSRGRVEAVTLEGDAQRSMGNLRRALVLASRASALARTNGTPEDRLDAGVERAEVLTTLGQRDAALAAYDGAARIVESMTDDFERDLDRARFSARQDAPFDSAVALLLRSPRTRARTAALLRWSERRKAVAFGRDRGPPLSLARVQSRLGRDRALVDYLLFGGTSAALVVTRTRATVVSLGVSSDSITALASALRRPLTTTYLGHVDLARAHVDSRAARALSRALLHPVLPFVGGSRHLTIVPEGPLYLLPFDLLPVNDSTSVLDRFAVTLLPSARLVGASSGSGAIDPDAGLLLVEGTAPGTKREVEAIAGLWPDHHTRVITDASATEALVRTVLPRYAVVHFATHAVIEPGDPLASHLVLRPGGGADGLFEVRQIERVRSHAALVVLSACETENGRAFAGVGPMGLARAFLVGGARAVVATQWPVGAAAADFMRAFYSHLTVGARPDDALRAAKRALRARPATAHPFFWAGFVLIGEADFHFVPSASTTGHGGL